MEQQFNTMGVMDNDGFKIYDKNNLNVFLQAHKGKKMQMELKVFKEPSGGLIKYFYAVLIPKAQEGFNRLGNRFDKREVEKELKKQSPVTLIEEYDPTIGAWQISTRSLGDLSSSELCAFIDDAQRFCAIELEMVVPNPNEYE